MKVTGLELGEEFQRPRSSVAPELRETATHPGMYGLFRREPRNGENPHAATTIASTMRVSKGAVPLWPPEAILAGNFHYKQIMVYCKRKRVVR